ncbi:MAG: UbiD family decarboxylase [Candidatus Acidiferrales bacterium]
MTQPDFNCFRDQLRFLEEIGDVRRITRQVKAEFEVAGVTKRADPGPVLVFEHVDSHQMPVVMGLDSTRQRIARSLGTTPVGLIDKYAEAFTSLIKPVEVKDGPVKECKSLDVDLMRDLPVLTHYEKDGGPYITSGLVVAEDPTGEIRNVSYHRLQVTGPRELRALILPRHLRRLMNAAEERGEGLPIAIVIGCDTAQRLAGATWGASIPLGMDEYSISGALKGRPEKLVKCETSGIRVPAHAEIVIEATILPHERGQEGPFAEFTGNYGPLTNAPIIRVDAITRRNDAMYQGLLAFTSEHLLLLGLPYEPVIRRVVRQVLPDTDAVHVTTGGCGKFHVVVQIKKRHEADGRDAILAAFHAIRDIKHVTVVDSDVDPFDAQDVEWAVATRFQADKDLVVVERSWGNVLDPSTGGTAITAKLGIDATRPLAGGDRFVKVTIPGADQIQVSDYFQP